MHLPQHKTPSGVTDPHLGQVVRHVMESIERSFQDHVAMPDQENVIHTMNEVAAEID